MRLKKINWRSDLIVIDRLTSISAFAHLLLSGQTEQVKLMVCFIYCYHIKQKKADVSVCDPKISDLADLSKKSRLQICNIKGRNNRRGSSNFSGDGETKTTKTARRLGDIISCNRKWIEFKDFNDRRICKFAIKAR